MLAVTGYGTTIVTQLRALLAQHKPEETVERLNTDLSIPDAPIYAPLDAKRYLLAAGVLHGQPILTLSAEQLIECVSVNMINVLRICELALAQGDDMRVCVIGSWSASAGSFDRLYAATKAAVERYVLTRPVGKSQQLVAVSPTIISDSGMTRRRTDYPEVLERRKTVQAHTVALRVYQLLYVVQPDDFTNMVVPVK